MGKEWVNNIYKLYSNEERNGSTTYTNYIAMGKEWVNNIKKLYSNEERNGSTT